MIRRFLTSDIASLLLRVGLGVIFAHGLGKVEHGNGASWEPLFSPDTQLVIAWTEVVAGALILLGLFTRLSAVALAAMALVTGYIMLQNRPFFASEAHNLGANYDYLSVGAEYNFALLAISLALVILGGGLFSLDALASAFFRRNTRDAAAPIDDYALSPVGATE